MQVGWLSVMQAPYLKLTYLVWVLGSLSRHPMVAYRNTFHSCLSAYSSLGKALCREKNWISQEHQH